MWDFKPVDDLNTVPEQFRGLYNAEKGTDGKFTVSAVAQPLVTAYTGETTALAKARKDLAAANKESAGRRVTQQAVIDFATKLGLENVDQEDPLASVGTHITELLSKSKAGAGIAVNMDKIKQDYEKKNKELADNAAAAQAKMLASLQKHMIGEAAATAISANKGDAKLLRPFVEKNVKVVLEGDEYVVRVVDDAGEVRSNGAGGWMSIADRVAEMKTDPQYQRLFDSEAVSGVGTKPGATQRPAAAAKQSGEKSSVDKIASGIAKKQYDHAGQGARA